MILLVYYLVESLYLAPPNYVPGVGRGAHAFVTQYILFYCSYRVDLILDLLMQLRLYCFHFNLIYRHLKA